MTGAPLRTKSPATATVQAKVHDQHTFSQDDWPEVLMLSIIITVIVIILLRTAPQIESFSQAFFHEVSILFITTNGRATTAEFVYSSSKATDNCKQDQNWY